MDTKTATVPTAYNQTPPDPQWNTVSHNVTTYTIHADIVAELTFPKSSCISFLLASCVSDACRKLFKLLLSQWMPSGEYTLNITSHK